MDYRSSLQDDEHPAAASPWGTNFPPVSPPHNQPSFGAAPGALFGAQDPNNGLDDDDLTTNAFANTAPSENSQNYGFESPQDENQGRQQQSLPSSPEQAPRQQQQQQQQQTQPDQHQNEQRPGSQGQLPGQQPGQQQIRRPANPQYKLQAKITGLERAGKKDPILRFDVHTNITRFRTTQFRDVRRLHSEFVKLADHLISANPEALVPAVPPPVTSAGAGTEEDETRLKGLMQRWLNYVCSSQVLMMDDEMVLFVESDFGYSPMNKMKPPATGVRRKLLKQFAPPPDDTPELSEARPIVKLFYLGSMDAGHKVDKLVKARKGLGQAEADFATKLGNMHIQEPHPGLANAYRKLGKTLQTVGDWQQAQATAEATTVGDPFQYHSSDSFIVKETLTNRQLLNREFLQAQEITRSKLTAADRLKASSRVHRDKVDEAITALDEARAHEIDLMKKTQRVTHNLVQERRKWFARTAADLRLSIREYVLREIEAERRTLSLLESVRPDIRAIDASGGLSRLGRETHPTARRASVAASQGPKGDAWSGVPRRTDNMSRSMTGSLMGTGSSVTSGAVEEDDGASEGSSRPKTSGGMSGVLSGLTEEDDEDRVDARNAASRLATSTF